MPPDNHKMRIVSLSWYYIIGKVIAEYARKIEQIGNGSMKDKGILVVLIDGGSKMAS